MAIARFSLATTERAKDKDGNWQDKTEWHNLVAFGRTAEVAGEYLKKGRTVYIEGALRSSSWDDKETGQKKYKTEIIVNDLVMVGGQREGGEGGGGYSGGEVRRREGCQRLRSAHARARRRPRASRRDHGRRHSVLRVAVAR